MGRSSSWMAPRLLKLPARVCSCGVTMDSNDARTSPASNSCIAVARSVAASGTSPRLLDSNSCLRALMDSVVDRNSDTTASERLRKVLSESLAAPEGGTLAVPSVSFSKASAPSTTAVTVGTKPTNRVAMAASSPVPPTSNDWMVSAAVTATAPSSSFTTCSNVFSVTALFWALTLA